MLHEAEGWVAKARVGDQRKARPSFQGHEVRMVYHIIRLEGSATALWIAARRMRLPLQYQRVNLAKHAGRGYEQGTRYWR